MPKDTTFLLFDKSSEEVNTTSVLINQIDRVAINAKTTNLKAMVFFFFFFPKLLSIFNTHKKKGG